MIRILQQSEWDRRYAQTQTKPTPKKRGPKPGTRMQGRPPGETINRGTVMKKPLGAIVMAMWETDVQTEKTQRQL